MRIFQFATGQRMYEVLRSSADSRLSPVLIGEGIFEIVEAGEPTARRMKASIWVIRVRRSGWEHGRCWDQPDQAVGVLRWDQSLTHRVAEDSQQHHADDIRMFVKVTGVLA